MKSYIAILLVASTQVFATPVISPSRISHPFQVSDDVFAPNIDDFEDPRNNYPRFINRALPPPIFKNDIPKFPLEPSSELSDEDDGGCTTHIHLTILLLTNASKSSEEDTSPPPYTPPKPVKPLYKPPVQEKLPVYRDQMPSPPLKPNLPPFFELFNKLLEDNEKKRFNSGFPFSKF